MKTLLIALSLFISFSASTLAAEVISVGDGDTITVKENNQKVKVRMACIDAPESAQDGGQASANRLKQLLTIGTKVSLDKVDTDRYGRTVAIIFRDNLNINLTMVQEGQAVVYRKYLSNCPNSQRYIDAEDKAKQKGIGFWGIKNAVMPWEWREGKRATTSITKPNNSNSSNLPACVNSDCDCKDFSTQAQAQKVLDSFPGDPHRLDQDKDGIACESLP